MSAPLDPITALSNLGSEIVKASDDWFTSDEERAEANRALYLAQIDASLKFCEMQIRAYEADAKSGHKGWRHQLGVMLSLAVGMHFVVFPLLQFVAGGFGYTPDFPTLDMAQIMGLLGTLLGLGGWRSFDLKEGTRK
jgi:hypothetical protein